jgi:multidrug efflux pump subunit AcrA (membrane-fusion protein)
MSAKVAFLSRELGEEELKPITVVPPAAIVERNGHPTAFLVRETGAKEVLVETEGQIGDLAVVKKGLEPGDEVVLQPSQRLTDGSEIRLDEAK